VISPLIYAIISLFEKLFANVQKIGKKEPVS
jgi:hypothetical protein